MQVTTAGFKELGLGKVIGTKPIGGSYLPLVPICGLYGWLSYDCRHGVLCTLDGDNLEIYRCRARYLCQGRFQDNLQVINPTR
jgi:hypothetical protein